MHTQHTCTHAHATYNTHTIQHAHSTHTARLHTMRSRRPVEPCTIRRCQRTRQALERCDHGVVVGNVDRVEGKVGRERMEDRGDARGQGVDVLFLCPDGGEARKGGVEILQKARTDGDDVTDISKQLRHGVFVQCRWPPGGCFCPHAAPPTSRRAVFRRLQDGCNEDLDQRSDVACVPTM